jgi:hypothetical protein
MLQVMRDIQRSGQCAGEVIQQVSDTVYPMYKAFIEPDLNKAEIKVMNNFNPFAGFKEPIQILKTDDPVSVDTAYDVLKKLYPGEQVKRVRAAATVAHARTNASPPCMRLRPARPPQRAHRRRRSRCTTSSCCRRGRIHRGASRGCACGTRRVATA